MTDKLTPVRCGCGGEAKVIKHEFYMCSPTYGVTCYKCGTATNQGFTTEAEAVTAWNRAMCADRGLNEWCTDCKEYDQDKQCCHRWNRVIKNVVDEVRKKYDERTAKVEPTTVKNTYQCSNCGRPMHPVDFSMPNNYCSFCGAKLDWSGNE